MINRTIPPAFKPIESLQFVEAKTLSLTNNLPVHILEAGDQDVISIEWLFKAGSSYDVKHGQSFCTMQMLGEGTTEHTAQQINEAIDSYGAFISYSSGFDQSSIKVYTMTKFVREVIEIVKEVITKASFREDQLEQFVHRNIQNIKVNQEKNAFLASRAFRQKIFGAHPYAKSIEVEDLEQITRADLTPFYKKYLHLGNCSIIVAGKAEQDVLDAIEDVFGKELIHKIDGERDLKEIRPDMQHQLIERPKSLQSSIRIGKLMPQKGHPDYFRLLLANEVLGGYFGSRLMQNIREDKGYTYGIFSQIRYLKQRGFFVIGTDVNAENTQNTIDEIHKEINLMRTELVGDEELTRVKNYHIGSFAGEFTTPYAQATMFKYIQMFGLTYQFYYDYIDQINKVTAEDILNICQKYFDPTTMVEIVAGKK